MPKEPERKYPLGLIFQALQEGLLATCSEHSGAPRLQGWGGEALVLTGPSQASPIPSTWGWPTQGQGQAWD